LEARHELDYIEQMRKELLVNELKMAEMKKITDPGNSKEMRQLQDYITQMRNELEECDTKMKKIDKNTSETQMFYDLKQAEAAKQKKKHLCASASLLAMLATTLLRAIASPLAMLTDRAPTAALPADASLNPMITDLPPTAALTRARDAAKGRSILTYK